MKYLLSLLLTFFLAFGGNAEQPLDPHRAIELIEGKNYYELGLKIDLLEDESKKLTIKDILSSKYAKQFKRSKKEVPSFGFKKANFWAKVTLLNNTKSQKSWLFHQQNYTQDEITVYRNTEGQWRSSTTGDFFPFKTREVDARSFSFHIDAPVNKVTVFYVKITGVVNRMLFTLTTPTHFAEEEAKDNYVMGLFFGLILTIIALNSVLYLSTKEKGYLYYVLYVLTFGFALAINLGFAQKFIFKDFHWMNNKGFAIVSLFTSLFLSLFTITFLKLEKATPKLYKLLKGFAWVSLTLIILTPILPYSLGLKFFLGAIFIVTPIVIFSGIYRSRMRYRPAKHFVVAFGLWIFGTLITVFAVIGVLPTNFLTKNSMLIGNALELVILSIGLADKFNFILKEALLKEERAARNLKREVERQTVELRKKTEQLQDLDQKKTSFFQNISHELRTPLTLIMNPLESLKKRYNEDRDIQVADKNTKRLYRLVNQLLDFQKLSAGKKELSLSKVNLVKFINNCADMFKSSCSIKDIAFKVTLNGKDFSNTDLNSKDFFIQGEIDALEKIVFNYLSNALKYSPEKSMITLGLSNKEGEVKVSVKDEGRGISKSNQNKLFQVFSQVDDSDTRKFEGTGLGLALAKELAEHMKGIVGVDSEEGKGSLFWVSFPECTKPHLEEDLSIQNHEIKQWHLNGVADQNDEDEQMESIDSKVDSSEIISKQQTVLIVDDLKDMRGLISRALKRHNYRTLLAQNGEQGLEMAKAHKPDIIISDWMMPKVSGPEMIKQLKNEPNFASIPIILLTAKSDEDSKMMGIEVGADGFLGKPFNDQELVSLVRNLLSLKNREKEVEALNHQLTEKVLKRYLPPDLVEQIISGETSLEQKPEGIVGTILFSDIVGFTKLSGDIRASKLSRLLNDYLSEMVQIIYKHGGTIDKFIGDAIMVIFGAPTPLLPKEQALRAAACAKEMQAKMVDLNNKWNEEDIPTLKMRIGIHQGPLVVGTFGCPERSDYTSIGPTVNIASRIESVCSAGDVFISGELCDLLPEEMTEKAGRFELKGIGVEQNLYKVIQ